MESVVVWMDSEKATIFTLSATGYEKQMVKNHYHDHHTNSPADGPKQMESFFHEIIEQVKGAQEILLTGPGLAKNHFKTHLENHHHQEVAKKIVGVETSDHPTDNQLQAFAKKFFKKVHLFQGT